MSTDPVSLDRRQRRRQETIEEVLDIAAEIMAEQGVAGLSIGEVARRMGIRPPSLYVYFPSKNALYDALFARGAQMVLDHVRADEEAHGAEARPLDEVLLNAARTFVTWSVEHPAYSQLLFWRPVPGFTPSEEAYAPAIELVQFSQARLAEVQARGLLRSDVDVQDVQRDWAILLSGVISQQLSNAPDEPAAAGRFTAALPGLVEMFVRHYGADTQPSARGPSKRRTTRPKPSASRPKETRRDHNR